MIGYGCPGFLLTVSGCPWLLMAALYCWWMPLNADICPWLLMADDCLPWLLIVALDCKCLTMASFNWWWLAVTGYGCQRRPLTADGCFSAAMAALVYQGLFLTTDEAFHSVWLPWTELMLNLHCFSQSLNHPIRGNKLHYCNIIFFHPPVVCVVVLMEAGRFLAKYLAIYVKTLSRCPRHREEAGSPIGP
jgi:hypothetical protein